MRGIMIHRCIYFSSMHAWKVKIPQSSNVGWIIRFHAVISMPTLVEINGLDEAGRVGETIWLVRVGVRIDTEIQILLRNLEHFGKLIVRKSDLYGREPKNLMKYVRDTIDDPAFDVSIFRMRPQTQLRVMREYFGFLCDDMFRARKVLIDALKPGQSDQTSPEKNQGWSEEAMVESPIWGVTNSLKRFERHPFLCESIVKSYGMMTITARLDHTSGLFRVPLGPGAKLMLVVQIDGGYPFAFWWPKLVMSPLLSNMKKKNTHISGVSQGDGYYPTLSAAGAIANILDRCPQRVSFLPTRELTYDDNFPVDRELYDGHTLALVRPTFENRIVFVGKFHPDLISCLPYCIHRANRRKTYEPFHIEISSESFFNKYGYGKPENTIVIFGKLSSSQNKKDAWYCKSKGYQWKHVADLRKDFESLCTDVESEIDLLHKEKKAKLVGKFEKIKSEVLTDFV